VLSGNLTLFNLTNSVISGVTIRLLFPDLPAGVTLANETGTSGGIPYLDVTPSLLPRTGQAVLIEFRDPLLIPVSTFFLGFPVEKIIGIEM
jgi:hypothetical protein